MSVARVEAPPATQAVASVEVPSVATLRLDQIMPAAILPPPEVVAAPATGPATRPASRPATAPATAPATVPTTAPAPAASTRPVTRPTTTPTTARADADRPPIEALLLYGQAVDQLRANRRLAAVELLEKAVALDPASFELHWALGKAYSREGVAPDPRSLEALEKAAKIRPDHLRLQVELGRLYQAMGEEDKSLWHLRLALKTADYAADEAGAAVAELMLTRALAREGYHTAAVEVYERLNARLENPSGALRQHPEIAFLLMRPELLRLQAAESYEKTGRIDKALEAYVAAAGKDPGSFELRARVVRALVGLKRYDEAAAQAADAVARFRASPASIALLRETQSPGGAGAGGLVEELRRLVEKRPNERSLRFALADVMKIEGRADEARAVLRRAGEASPGDPEVVRRLYETERDAAPDGLAAAQFLVEWSWRYPDAVHLLGDHWDDLLRQPGPRRVGLRELRAMEMPADAPLDWLAARNFWVAHVARLRHRRDVAREALRAATQATPVFPPAMRAWAGWDRGELGLTGAERDSEVEQLAAAAAANDHEALAEELRGMMLLARRDFAGARARLARAVEIDDRSPERQFALAVAARGAGDEAAFERALWKIVSDWPGFEDAYDALHSLYEGRDAEGRAARVLAQWLAADPGNVPARVVQVREQLRGGRMTAAQALVQRLFADEPGDPRVLAVVRAMYGQGERTLAWLVAELQKRHAGHPGDLASAAQLVDLLAGQGRGAEATRVLDATRTAVAADPDLLYQVAHLYERVGQKATTDKVLRDVLEAEPGHAPAANDLGYSLAEAGRELGWAEQLTRLAVKAEPANASFLDSLGWVLYKRGKLAEARTHLEKSAQVSAGEGDAGEKGGGGEGAAEGAGEGAGGAEVEGPDPVVLDHLGDTIYRLGDAIGAGRQWEHAVRRLAEMPPGQRDREDLKQLRLQLDRKRKQLEAGQPVSTAPVVETPGPAARRVSDGAPTRTRD